MVRPVASRFPVTLGYRQKARFDPNYIHRGIDYGCPTSTPVVATTSGTVVYAGRGGGYGPAFGIHVVIRTGNIWHLYGHLSSEQVSTGQSVQGGQQVGRSGATGNVTGAHLHYAEFTQPPAAYKSDRRPLFVDYVEGAPAVPGPTVFDICEWNIARPRWYTPWKGRAAEIARELKDEASVYCFQELFEAEQIATVKAALPRCEQFSGPAGLEFFYDVSPDRWVRVSAQNHYSGIANRHAQEVTLRRVSTGQLVTFWNIHAPITAEGSTAKARYGSWLASRVRAATHPAVIAGDFNASEGNSPKKELRALGYIGFKEQVAAQNEGTKEFIPQNKDLCDIRTRPAGPADVTRGLVDLSTNSLESDHRRLEAQVTVHA